jgi:hypothetical protein
MFVWLAVGGLAQGFTVDLFPCKLTSGNSFSSLLWIKSTVTDMGTKMYVDPGGNGVIMNAGGEGGTRPSWRGKK